MASAAASRSADHAEPLCSMGGRPRARGRLVARRRAPGGIRQGHESPAPPAGSGARGGLSAAGSTSTCPPLPTPAVVYLTRAPPVGGHRDQRVAQPVRRQRDQVLRRPARSFLTHRAVDRERDGASSRVRAVRAAGPPAGSRMPAGAISSSASRRSRTSSTRRAGGSSSIARMARSVRRRCSTSSAPT
jgi:hypothetical protein